MEQYEILHGIGAVLFNVVMNFLFFGLGVWYGKSKDESEED